MDDEKTLSDYNIQNLSILHLFDIIKDDVVSHLQTNIPKIFDGNISINDYTLVGAKIGWFLVKLKDDPNYLDLETVNKILGLLEKLLQFYKKEPKKVL